MSRITQVNICSRKRPKNPPFWSVFRVSEDISKHLTWSHVLLSLCQIINLLAGFLALLLPPSGDLSYHLALAFLPSPNIYPQIDLSPQGSLSSGWTHCHEHNLAWGHMYDPTSTFMKEVVFVRLVIVLLCSAIERKESIFG